MSYRLSCSVSSQSSFVGSYSYTLCIPLDMPLLNYSIKFASLPSTCPFLLAFSYLSCPLSSSFLVLTCSLVMGRVSLPGLSSFLVSSSSLNIRTQGFSSLSRFPVWNYLFILVSHCRYLFDVCSTTPAFFGRPWVRPHFLGFFPFNCFCFSPLVPIHWGPCFTCTFSPNFMFEGVPTFVILLFKAIWLFWLCPYSFI